MNLKNARVITNEEVVSVHKKSCECDCAYASENDVQEKRIENNGDCACVQIN